MQIRERIKQISLFSHLKENEHLIDNLLEIITEKSYPKGTYIIREDEIGDTMFILSEGNVVVEKKTRFGDEFPVIKLSDKMNVFFGELALLDSDHRSASVIAETNTVCYLIKRVDFDRFCENHPQLGYHIVREIAITLAHNLRKTTHDKTYLIDALCNQEDKFDIE